MVGARRRLAGVSVSFPLRGGQGGSPEACTDDQAGQAIAGWDSEGDTACTKEGRFRLGRRPAPRSGVRPGAARRLESNTTLSDIPVRRDEDILRACFLIRTDVSLRNEASESPWPPPAIRNAVRRSGG